MASSPYEELRAAQLCKVSNALARQRMLVVGGFNIVIFGTLACAGIEIWRLALVTFFGLSAFAWQATGGSCAVAGPRTTPASTAPWSA
jgi:xanthine/uracil permease